MDDNVPASTTHPPAHRDHVLNGRITKRSSTHSPNTHHHGSHQSTANNNSTILGQNVSLSPPTTGDSSAQPSPADAANGETEGKKPSGQATNGASATGLNPRSCVICRRRKVKCDKKQPCSHCVRANVQCVFPAPGRAPRKPRKPPDAELMERLKRLEGLVKGLGVQVSEEVRKQRGGGPGEEGAVKDGGEVVGEDEEGSETDAEAEAEAEEEGEEDANPGCEQDGLQKGASTRAMSSKGEGGKSRSGITVSKSSLENRFGRLVVEEGRSRYVNNSYWANLGQEVEDLKSLLHRESSDEDEDQLSPTAHDASRHQGFLFGFSSQNVDMMALHPPVKLIPLYWSIYKENLDPLIKVLHTPTMEQELFKAKDQLAHVPKGMEALMFAIYYGTVTSLLPIDCASLLGEDKTTLLKRYRFAIEQALARANFLTSDEIIVLQALVIFLICLRRNEEARVIWTLSGLVVRIAQTLGIHRDGTHFNLSPFETEIRRRLWWQVCILDTRASEDHGCDPTIVESLFDTKMPSNVNDADIHPNMTEFPQSHIGCTEMTFCLIRFEVANVYRRIQFVPPNPSRCTEFFTNVTLEQKEKWIRECQQRIEDRYLKHCDMSVPLFWVTATVSRLIMSKIWLMAYHPYQRLDGGSSLPQSTKDRLFITSLENIEYSMLLETETRTMKWGWLFRTYTQWHAIAFLLSELCVRTRGEAVDRAWRAVDAQFMLKFGDPYVDKRGHGLWKPLRKIYAVAKQAREKELSRMDQEDGNSSAAGVYVDIAGLSAPPPPQSLSSTMGAAHNSKNFSTSADALAASNVSPAELYVLRSDAANMTAQSLDDNTADLRSTVRSDLGLLPANSTRNNATTATTATSQMNHNMPIDWSLHAAFPGAGSPPSADAPARPHAPYRFQPYTMPSLTAMGPDSSASATGNNNNNNITDAIAATASPSSLDNANPQHSFDVDVDAGAGAGAEDTEMNWESWDDMVREFGMEIDSQSRAVVGGGGGEPGVPGASAMTNTAVGPGLGAVDAGDFDGMMVGGGVGGGGVMGGGGVDGGGGYGGGMTGGDITTWF